MFHFFSHIFLFKQDAAKNSDPEQMEGFGVLWCPRDTNFCLLTNNVDTHIKLMIENPWEGN